MVDVTPIRPDLRVAAPSDDPMEIWQGVADVNRDGVALAYKMLMQLEELERDDMGIELASYACLEDWPRQGRPFRNLVAEYLKAARNEGPEVEAGFCAVLTDIVGLICSGEAPGAERYSDARFTCGASA